MTTLLVITGALFLAVVGRGMLDPDERSISPPHTMPGHSRG